jgi:hypothetical protein
VQGLQHLLLERAAARNEVDCARVGGDELAAHLAELGKGTGGQVLGSEVGVHDACLRILSQRAAGFLRVCGMAAHAGSVCFVPDLPTDFVERLGRPGHDVEAFRAHLGVRVALLHDLALGAEQVEELPACLLVVTGRRSEEPPAVVVDDYRDVTSGDP